MTAPRTPVTPAPAARGTSGCGSCPTRFAGRTPLQRHRLVNEALAPLLETEMHALDITPAPRRERLTPDEFRTVVNT